MKHSLSVEINNVLLRPVRSDDLESLRNWRNDRQHTKFLSKIDFITTDAQKAWYENDRINQDCYTFAVAETHALNRVVGSVALYGFSGKTAEFGRFLIGDIEARGRGIGFFGTVLCLYLGFTELGLSSITAHVHEENIAALKAYLKSGFAVTQNNGHELEIIVEKDRFLLLHNFLSEIKITNQSGELYEYY